MLGRSFSSEQRNWFKQSSPQTPCIRIKLFAIEQILSPVTAPPTETLRLPWHHAAPPWTCVIIPLINYRCHDPTPRLPLVEWPCTLTGTQTKICCMIWHTFQSGHAAKQGKCQLMIKSMQLQGVWREGTFQCPSFFIERVWTREIHRRMLSRRTGFWNCRMSRPGSSQARSLAIKLNTTVMGTSSIIKLQLRGHQLKTTPEPPALARIAKHRKILDPVKWPDAHDA